MSITLRRFRLAKKARTTAKRKQYIFNVNAGKLRQICLEYSHPGRSRKAIKSTYRFPTAVSSLLILIGFCGITFSAAALSKPKVLPQTQTFAEASKPQEPSKPIVAAPKFLASSEPIHLTLASQQIDVDLKPVGLAPDGSIEVPAVTEWVAGWYKYSPTPGELGPAVIVGHVDSYEGPSVFWRLRNVQAGEIVEITRTDGSVARFKITQLAEYDQNNFPTEAVYGNTDTAQLRLITCSGTFDSATQHYTQNTVVYAELIS